MMKVLFAVCLLAGIACTTFAQVSTTTQSAPDNSQSQSQVAVSTKDHTFVPLTVSTAQTTVDSDTTRTDTTTKLRQIDGTYLDWRTTTAETKKLSDTAAENTSQMIEKDRQGGSKVVRTSTESVTKNADGTQQNSAKTYKRNSSGELVLDNQSTAVTIPVSEGVTRTTRMESKPDTNGKLIPTQRTDEVVTKVNDNETQSSKTTQTYNHIDATYTASVRENVTEKKNGYTTVTETVVQKPRGSSWETSGKVTVTETRNADGTVQRETVESSRPAFAKYSSDPDHTEPLTPQQKVVEREVKRADGSTITEREVLHKDVNGDWKPETFSTEAATRAY